MRNFSFYVPFPGKVSIPIVAVILLAISITVLPQGVNTPLKPVYSPEKKLYGYIDTLTSKLVIKHQFRQAGKFYRGLAIVKKESGYGIIDTNGKAVYPLNSTEITQSLNPDVFIVRESKKFKYGALDYELKQVIPFEYDRITPVGKVLVVTRFGPPNQLAYELSGIYNSSFELIVPVEINSRLEEKVPGYISNTVGNRVGLITTEGKVIIPFNMNYVQVHKEAGIVMAQNESYKWQAYGLDGTLVSDLSFEEYRSAGAGSFLVEMNDKWGLFRGKLLTQCVYDWIKEPDYANGTFILQKNRKSGVTDTTGRETVPYQFDLVSRYGNDMFLVSSGKSYGLYNRSGKVIIPCEFDSVPAQPVNNCFVLKDDRGRYGCITIEGTRTVPFVIEEEYVQSNYSVASSYLKKLLEISPGHPEFIYLDALGYCSHLNQTDAVAYVSKIISGYSDSRNVPDGLYFLRSRLYADMNSIKEADEDAFRTIPSMYSHRAYMYLGDRMLKQEDLGRARNFYHYAGLYFNKEEALAREQAVLAEMKKRGLYRETAATTAGQAATPAAADLPTTLFGFAKADRMEYAGNSGFRRLFSYDQAVAGVPAGFRLPTRGDWLNLIKYISDDRRISSGNEYLAVGDIGRGWNTGFTEEGVLQDRNYTFYSKDTYGLGISPLRSYSYTVELTETQKRFDVITYWIETTMHEGNQVNCIEITPEGFRFVNNASGKACVRYIKK